MIKAVATYTLTVTIVLFGTTTEHGLQGAAREAAPVVSATETH